MKYLKVDFLIPFLWFCVLQPMLFFVCVAVIIGSAIDHMMGLI
jgi:hypothetical protein